MPSGSLGTLNLLGNSLGVHGAQAVVAAYEQSTKLQSLCGLTAGVTSLDLSRSGLMAADAMLLAAELKKGVTTGSLGTLNLAKNQLCGLNEYRGGTYDPTGILALAEALKVPSGSLGTLDLADNKIGPDGAAALAEALKVPSGSLVTLDLPDNQIGPDGAAALAEALKVPNGSLVTLDLSWNSIKPEVVVVLAEALKVSNGSSGTLIVRRKFDCLC